MSRYIDAEALLNSLPDDLPYKASVKRVLIQAPTADALALIKELTDRIEILETQCKLNDRVGMDFIKRGKELKKLQEENKRLLRELTIAEVKLEGLNNG